jgi:glycosyltransferase involved in cell wall biosynthesis
MYEANDPDGLKDALQRACSVDLGAMGAHNRGRADEFDWGRIAAATLEVYRSMRAG